MKYLAKYPLYEEAKPKQLEDLEYLVSVGLIDQVDYVKLVYDLVNSGEIQIADIPETDLPVLNIENIDGGDDALGWFRQWIKKWRGPGGVYIAFAEGSYDETHFDLRLTLSNGDRITADWDGYYGSWKDFYLERPGVAGRVEVRDKDDVELELEDKYDAEYDAEFFHDWLDALVNSASSTR